MNFFKRHFFVTVIAFFVFLFADIAVLVFIYPVNYQACSNKVAKLNDNQILAERFVKNRKYVERNSEVFDEYFMCKIDFEDESSYEERLSSYLDRFSIDSRYSKYFNNLSDVFLNKSKNKIVVFYKGLDELFAFGDEALLTGDKVYKVIKKSFEVSGAEFDPKKIWLASDTDEKIRLLLNDDDFFRRNIMELKFTDNKVVDDDYVHKKKGDDLRHWKVALAYRKGGAELAYKICDGMYGKDYSYCRTKVKSYTKYLDEYKNMMEHCNNLVNNFSELVCK